MCDNINGNISQTKDVIRMAGGAQGVLGNPSQTPQQLVLTGTAIDGTNGLFFDDAMALSSTLGVVGGAGKVAMTPTIITAAILKEYLKTNALIIKGYNFETTAAPLLSNNLTLVYSSIDGNTKTTQLFSAKSVSNQQQNPLLLNVVQPFVWTNNMSMKIPINGTGASYTFTFDIIAAVPYGSLDAFLQINQIPTLSKVSC